jgi:hypothetical protein
MFFKTNTQTRHIPSMTLIKGTEVFKNVQLLSGYCNTALYIKVGQKLEVLAVPPLFLQESGHSGGMEFVREAC